MVVKPGEDYTEVEPFRPIAMLPIMLKFETLILSRLKPIIEKFLLVLYHQFSFRNTAHVHRITDIIDKSLKPKIICFAIFLNIGQTFDRVWHDGLLHE